jgi:hypothetical protein
MRSEMQNGEARSVNHRQTAPGEVVRMRPRSLSVFGVAPEESSGSDS